MIADNEKQDKQKLSELHENIWAVISERGCEGMDLTYMEAAILMRTLENINIFGLCVVTSEAARREMSLSKM